MAASLVDRLRPPEEALPPAPHLGLGWRTLEAADADALFGLVQRCEEVDEPLHRTTPAEITDALSRPERGLLADAIGGYDASGTLQAAAWVNCPPGDATVARAFVVATIDPSWRGRGIGRALLSWQDDRARQLLARTGLDLPARIAAYVDEHMVDRRRLYAAAGFSPKRVFRHMRRPVTDPLPDAPVPDGLRIVDWSPELDEAVRLTHNEAFQDHWGSQPVSSEAWSTVHRDLEPRWSKIALARTDSGDEVAGYAMTCRHERDWAAQGVTEGYTELLGVLRPYRGGGTAKAVLVAVLRALAEDGIDYAGLDVDTENPSGAHQFYERLGYQPLGASLLYTIEV
ncbi:GNAT family N-acetyltransferase [Georgenia sp. 10Sc9-8]|uniref:GNAT family N-acetyltransferase n=1 Tax=Georgenia halotolerans TaxID=3028317 RepID=A0ABT5U2L1_9MICO|nr:GNAT family N-acetyltransferase [Georgenia halotolerans]